MTRRKHAATMLAVLAGAAPAAGCGSGTQSKSGAQRPHERTVRITLGPPGRAGIDGDFTAIFQQSRRPFIAGDSFIKWDNLPGGGFELEYCTIARQEPMRTFRCTRTSVLPKGQIIAVGDYDDSPDGETGTIPVVGGTGAYRGVHGSLTNRFGRRGGLLTFRLR